MAGLRLQWFHFVILTLGTILKLDMDEFAVIKSKLQCLGSRLSNSLLAEKVPQLESIR